MLAMCTQARLNHRILDLPEMATAPPAKRATPARPPEIPSSIWGTPNWMNAIERYCAQPKPTWKFGLANGLLADEQDLV
jgi:hypothetical protein